MLRRSVKFVDNSFQFLHIERQFPVLINLTNNSGIPWTDTISVYVVFRIIHPETGKNIATGMKKMLDRRTSCFRRTNMKNNALTQYFCSIRFERRNLSTSLFEVDALTSNIIKKCRVVHPAYLTINAASTSALQSYSLCGPVRSLCLWTTRALNTDACCTTRYTQALPDVLQWTCWS